MIKSTRLSRKEKEESIKAQVWNQYDIDETLAKFSIDEPFYSHISSVVNKRKSEKIGTAGVTVENGEFILYYNEEFFNGLDWRQKQGLLIHEFLHLIFNHVTSRSKYDTKGKPNKYWYFACDFAINSLIEERRLPPGGLIPGQWSDIPIHLEHLYTQEYLEAHKIVQKTVRSWDKGESSEWYYNEILKEKEAFDIIIGDDYGFDDHDGWESVSSGEQEIVSEKIRNVMEDGIELCERCKKWGSVPSDLQQKIRNIVEGQVDWETLLRNFIGNNLTVHKNSTIKRINRRYPYVHPGKRRQRTARIVICVDQSGSVDKKSLSKFFGEMDNLAEFTEFTVVPFDSRVVEKGIFVWKKNQRLDPERVAGGGTDFDVPTTWVNNHFSEFDAAIFMTDGYCFRPRDCLISRAWVICKGGELQFDTNELVINMK